MKAIKPDYACRIQIRRLCVPVLLGVAASPATADVQALGDGFHPMAISGNGSVVAGYGSAGGKIVDLAGGTESGNLTYAGYGSVEIGGLSNDGKTAAGTASDFATGDYVSKALRWTAAGGLVALPPSVSGGNAEANAVSGDGNTIVGAAARADGGFAAVFWYQGGTTGAWGLSGGSHFSSKAHSRALGVSQDGRVIVGYAATESSVEAFRWVESNGVMAGLGFLSGKTASEAHAVSADGQVVVGNSYTFATTGDQRAFRWVGGSMSDLGLPSGMKQANAVAVNADGSVVVGDATSNAYFGVSGDQAFRWNSTGGMQSVAAWLAANGVDASGSTFSKAVGVSADGSVVVGQGTINGQNQGYIARIAASSGAGGTSGGSTSGGGTSGSGSSGSGSSGSGTAGNGVIGLLDLNRSLGGLQQVVGQIAQRFGLNLWGAHHRTLMDAGVSGERGIGVWATGDYAAQRDGGGRQGLGEFGIFHDLSPALRWGIGLGRNDFRQDLAFGGNAKADGSYLVLEGDYSPDGRRDWVFSLTGLYGRIDATFRRGYLNGALLDASSGSPDAESWAMRLRADRYGAWQTGAAVWSPFVAYTHVRQRIDAYTEQGGAFPVAYGRQRQSSDELRGGVVVRFPLGASTDLRASGELIAARNRSGRTSGQLLGAGGFAFDLGGDSKNESWARLGLELDHRFAPNVLVSASLNAASDGNDPQWSSSLGLRYAF